MIFVRNGLFCCLVSVLCVANTGCSPKVTIQAPDKPITVNLNVKLEQEVRVKVEKDIEELIESRSELFK